VIQRWRHLRHPERTEPPGTAGLVEALGVSVLGLLWALVTLGLGASGHHALGPLLLLAGLLALWGWRGADWLWWFPAGVVAGTLLELAWPPASAGVPGNLRWVDLLVLGVSVVAVTRSIALRRPLVPRTVLDPVAAGLLVLSLIEVVLDRPGAVPGLRRAAVMVAVYYAAASIASRRGGARWVWPAFPLAAAVLGVQVVLWALGGADALRAHATLADAAWDAPHALAATLLVALTLTVGLALDAGRAGARAAWSATALAGATGLALLLAAGAALATPPRADGLVTPAVAARALLALAALAIAARTAWRLHLERAHEAPRWASVTVACVALALLLPFAAPYTGDATRLLAAVAAGLAAGTARADARTLRVPAARPGAAALAEAA
jgi:hypothetical protein